MRFALPINDEEVEIRSKSGIPKNTMRRNKWALNTWTKWSIARNNRREVEADIDHSHDKWTKITSCLDKIIDEELDYWLSKFVLEVRKENGAEYPPKTVLSLVMGIQSYLRIDVKRNVDLLNSDIFSKCRQVLDGEMKRLSSKGLGSQRKQAEAIKLEDEEKLWTSKQLGDFNAKLLVRTIHFLNGKNFSLRGGQEHRRLRFKPSQITLHEADGVVPYLKYTEDISKTCQGGIKHRKLAPKIVKHFANNDCPERCHVRLYKRYMHKSPTDGRDDCFYLTPLQQPREDMWYSRQPIGANTLATFTKEAFTNAGIEGHYTNHSLRATTASRLFEARVDEQLIMARTGHRSVEGKIHECRYIA